MYQISERVYGAPDGTESASGLSDVFPTYGHALAYLDLLAAGARRVGRECVRPGGGRMATRLVDEDGSYVRTHTIVRAY